MTISELREALLVTFLVILLAVMVSIAIPDALRLLGQLPYHPAV